MTKIRFRRTRSLPVIRQSEITDCGHACIAMVAQYFGHEISMAEMRRRFPTSLTGATLRDLISMANAIDIDTRPIRIELEDLINVRTPAILHWKMSHFVVLRKVTKKGLTIHDPGSGKKFVTFDSASANFTGVVLECAASIDFQAITDAGSSIKSFGRLWSKLDGIGGAISKLLIASLIFQLLVLLAPLFQQIVIDEAVATGDTSLLTILALGFLGLLVLRFAVSAVRSWLVLYYGNQISFQLTSNLVRHLFSLPVPFFERRHIGDLTSRILSTQPIRHALSEGIVNATIDAIMACVTLIAMLAYSVSLTFIVLAGTTLRFFVALAFFPIIRAFSEKAIVSAAIEQSQILENLRGIVAIKTLGREDERISVWKTKLARVTNNNIRLGAWETSLLHLTGAISAGTTVLVIYAAAMLILDSTISFTIGMLFAFIAYEQIFSSSMQTFLERLKEFRLLGLHFERLSDIADQTPEPCSVLNYDATENDTKISIELIDLSFSYGHGRPDVIDSVSLSIAHGEYIAIIGPSGCGKSTMVKLLAGLYEPTSGGIDINGHSLATFGLGRWRARLGVVMQDDNLFTGTILENICFFDPEPDVNKVKSVANLTGVHDDIESFPMGYRSYIGEMGSALSGGQQQKILLARALYRDPSVLIFDEGTANLDLAAERDIADLVEGLPMTRIVVAHRPELVKRASQIFELVNGRLVARSINDLD